MSTLGSPSRILIAALCALLGGECLAQADKTQPIPVAGNQAAPEFRDIAEWINSPALSMKQLRGKVVVVHFLAYG